MQTSAMKARFQIAECSFSSAKIRLFFEIPSKIPAFYYFRQKLNRFEPSHIR